MREASFERWSCAKSAELYGIRNWGADFFQVGENGEVWVYPNGAKTEHPVSLMKIVEGLEARGTDLPVLLRFSDILNARISRLNDSFRKVIKEYGYRGEYRGVFPVKVNQQEQVVRKITEYGAEYHHGLEAGSKAELIVAMSYMHDPEAYIICNGYKDQEFVDLALYALKMGLRVILVVEMPAELDIIIERAEKLQVKPMIGIRARLSSRASGHWNESGGDRSVFGLNCSQIIDVIDKLREKEMLDCLELLHYHLGSQIPNIRDIRNGLAEACRYYVDMVHEGAKMGILDIGGGLAVDYDGSHTNFSSSRNYGVNEYCADVIETIQKICDESEVAHPTIISESGRATVAYSAVLLFKVLDVSKFHSHDVPESLPEDISESVKSLMDVTRTLTSKNFQECYHDAIHYRDDLRSDFTHGRSSLRERAMGEQIFWQIMHQVADEAAGKKYVPDEITGLEDALSDIFYCNFSVFQSLPDAWAIDQLFPIMPIHHLEKAPIKKAIISDITCDCDGKIDKFIDLHDVKNSLPVHERIPGEDYILGVFLVGAYQETLGDLHNLMGDTNVVSVQVDEKGNISLASEIEGDTVADVLSYVEYDIREMHERFRKLAERAVAEGRITPVHRRRIMEAYRQGVQGYTYYEIGE